MNDTEVEGKQRNRKGESDKWMGTGVWDVGKWENNRGKKKMETKERPESGNAISKNENKKKRMK